MDDYRKKLLSLFSQSDYDLKSASIALGKNHSYLYQHIHKGSPRKLDGDDRRKLAMLLKANERDLLQAGEVLTDIKPIPIMDESEEGFTKVPVYDVACSAGNGVVVDSEHVLYHLSFRTQWLKSISSAPIDKMAVIRVEGDSMQPTLSHDDTVLIDMTQTYPRGDGIYVVVYDGMLLVKRVRIDPVRSVAEILSDNPCYSPVTGLVPDQIKVAGRVIWLGRRV